MEAVVSDRNGAQKHVGRAQIILTTAEGRGTAGHYPPCRRFEALYVALARALHARGRGRTAARQDEKARIAAIAGRAGLTCGGADAHYRSGRGAAAGPSHKQSLVAGNRDGKKWVLTACRARGTRFAVRTLEGMTLVSQRSRMRGR